MAVPIRGTPGAIDERWPIALRVCRLSGHVRNVASAFMLSAVGGAMSGAAPRPGFGAMDGDGHSDTWLLVGVVTFVGVLGMLRIVLRERHARTWRDHGGATGPLDPGPADSAGASLFAADSPFDGPEAGAADAQ